MKERKRLSIIVSLFLIVCMLFPSTVIADQKVSNWPFTDVPEQPGNWVYDSAKYVYDRGIMTGMTKTAFGPAEKLSRGQFATILYRIADPTGVTYKQIFPDVKASDWFGLPVTWANESGIITGYKNGTFGPADPITREQIAVMLYRYAQYFKFDTSKKADFSKYPDADKVSSWAVDAMQWAVGNSIITGKDNGKKLDPTGNASRAECATMIQRFIQKFADASDEKQTSTILPDSTLLYLEDKSSVAPYYQQAEKRKQEILNSATEIVKSDTFIRGKTYTGTAWYISPNGDNENDGRTPETAWKTADRVNWGDIQEGDAVFFERGGVYRLDYAPITLITDVTYSAYGKGAKPVITLAQENSARPECWTLWYEGKNGQKIWKYYQAVGETGGIVFDDTSYARRIFEWPTPNGWLAVDMIKEDPAHGVTGKDDPTALLQIEGTGEYRTVEEQLTEDMTYICRVDISNFTYPFDFGQDYRVGDLYLRCDKGNPGELYNDIEVISLQRDEYGDTYGRLMDGAHGDGYVIDNLSLKYYIDQALFSFLQSGNYAVIQNCTVEWGGNRLHQVQSAEPTNNWCLIGDGIYGLIRNVTIRNNYMRQSGNGATFESSNWEDVISYGNYTVTGNLVENCGQGLRTYFIGNEYKGAFESMSLTDNIIIDSGDSMNNACTEEPVAIDLGNESVQYAKKINVTGNIMIESTLAMLRMPDRNAVKMNISDNVIAQWKDGVLATEFTPEGIIWHMMKDVK